MSISYEIGDATVPKTMGHALIVHCCNDLGRWGSGFVLAISAKWPQAEAVYRNYRRLTGHDYVLGDVQFIDVEPEITVANLIGQHGTVDTSPTRRPPIRYPAIRKGLQLVAARAKELKASVHMPRMGCGLAGGSWGMMQPIIAEELKGLDVTVYDLPGGSNG